ncbi:MAG: CHAT domain-containing protein [Pyrinomonadaceae bacterium]
MFNFQFEKGEKIVRFFLRAFILLSASAVIGFSQTVGESENAVRSNNFEDAIEPFTIVLLLDTSATETQIKETYEAANAFVDQLKEQQSVCVIAFSEKTHILSEPTSDKREIHRALEKVKSKDFRGQPGRTAVFDAIAFALQELKDVKGRKAIVQFTDGADTVSKKADYDGTVRKAEESGAMIFSIYVFPDQFYSDYDKVIENPILGSFWWVSSLRQSDARRAGMEYLEDLAAYTSGKVFFPEASPDGIKKVFAEVGEVIHRLSTIPMVADLQTFEDRKNENGSNSSTECGSKTYKKSSRELRIGKVKKRWKPKLPETLKKAGLTGEVKVLITTDEKGNVIKARAFSGPPLLREHSEKEAYKLEFEKTLLCGEPIEFSRSVTFPFPPTDPLNEQGAVRIRAAATISAAGGSLRKGTVKDLQNALSGFEYARTLYRKIGDQYGEATALEGIGSVYAVLGDKEKALDHYRRAMTLYEIQKAPLEQSEMLNKIGLIESLLGNQKEALELYREALPISRDIELETLEARTLRNMGLVYSGLGQKEKALNYYYQALSIQNDKIKSYPFYTNVEDKLEEAITLNHIGTIFAELGNSQKALEFFHRALPILIIFGHKQGEVAILNNIGLSYSNLGERQKALKYYFQALQVSSAIEYEKAAAAALTNIGTIYLDLGDNRRALQFYNRALGINKSAGDRRNEARNLNNLGLVYGLEKDRKAFDFFNQALLAQRSIGDKAGEANTLRNLMWLWEKFANSRIAILYGKQSVNKYQELRQAIQGLDKDIQKDYLGKVEPTYRGLADLLISEGHFARAEQVLRMLKEEEFFDFVRRDSDEIKNLNQTVALNEKEQKLIEKYNELADRVTEIGREFQEIERQKRELSRENLNLPTDQQKRFEKLSAQLQTANAAFSLFLEKTLIEELGGQVAKEIEYDRNLQAKLRRWGDGTVALYTVVGEDRYRVIVTTPTVQTDGKTEIKRADLNKKIFAFRQALQNPKIDPRPLGRELYDILIKPVEKVLDGVGAKTLVWSLDGTLRYVPLAALSPDGNGYLVEKYQNVIITPKTRDDISDSVAEWRALGLGVSEQQTVPLPDRPDEKVYFDPLPGAREELMAIIRDEQGVDEKGVLIGRRYLNGDFTARNLSDSLLSETADGRKKYTVVHIASHFRLGSNWSNSFLLLGNGEVLTLEEITNSPNISFGEVDLITLSACNTAFADGTNGKEIDSLAEAIQTRSGKAVLATLWSVSDESTSLLMSEFYRLRKEHPGMTKAEAIQLAQRAMIGGNLKSGEASGKRDVGVLKMGNRKELSEFREDENAPFAHPFYWSPFILIGNWR